MKKIYTLLALAALVSVSCAREELVQPSEQQGTYLTLEGTFEPATRISIGDKDGSSWPVLWSSGDAIGILSQDGSIDNVAARVTESSVGQNVGTFKTSDPVNYPEGAAQILLYYPYNEYAQYEGQVLTTTVPSEQIHGAVNTNEHLTQNTVAYATADIPDDPETAVQFSLNHITAYVRVRISSTEFTGYTLKSVTLADKSSAASPLSGELSLNLKLGRWDASPSNSKSYVRTNLTGATIGTGVSEVWLAALPADFSSKDLSVAVEMVDPSGTRTVTVPVKVRGNLKANAVNTVEVLNLATSDNAYSWYEPVETRDLVNGWAYGESNCFVINAGTTETAQEQTIQVKARGHFGKVQEPKYAVLVYGNHTNATASNGRFWINGDQTPSTYSAAGEGIELKAITPGVYHDLDGDYSFRAKSATTTFTSGELNYKNLALGLVSIYAADQKTILWSVALYGRAASEFQTVTMACGKEIMAHNLGGQTANWDDWKNGGAYYQWGRPIPYSWSGSIHNPTDRHCWAIKENDVIAGKYGDMLEFSIQNPLTKLGVASNFPLAKDDWHVGTGMGVLSDRNQGFWGNPDPSDPNGGHKTIYDPCPKGWRVISPDVIAEWEANVSSMELVEKDETVNSSGKTTYYMDFLKYTVGGADCYIPLSGCGFHAQDKGNFQYMARPYGKSKTANAEGKWPNTGGYQNTKLAAFCWSNAPVSAASHEATSFGYWAPERIVTGDEAANVRPTDDFLAYKGGRANAFPVRCMKDTENR